MKTVNKLKRISNIALAGVATAMGIAVIVLKIVGADVASDDYVMMLAIGGAALGLLALNNVGGRNTD